MNLIYAMNKALFRKVMSQSEITLKLRALFQFVKKLELLSWRNWEFFS